MKLSKCRNKACSNTFQKRSMSHIACGPDCAQVLAEQKRLKAKRIADRAERRRDKERLLEFRTIYQLKAAAQKEFNAFIRERDRNEPCICCGLPLDYGAAVLTGGKYDAGHYRSTGSADHLRYNEDNCHAQRKVCNQHGAGRHVAYRIGLIQRIGLARVEAVENDNATLKWTREHLLEIIERYRRKTAELKKARS